MVSTLASSPALVADGSVQSAADSRKVWTVRDYRAMPEDGPRCEVINGELIMAPAPNRYHQQISRELCRIIYSHLHIHRIGHAYDAPFDVYLDDFNVVQPDLVFVAKGSSCKLIPEGVEGSPDLVVEILSYSTSKRDLRDKKELYCRFGSKEFWVISPETRQVQVYRLQEEADRPSAILEERDTLTTELMPGLEIPVAELFADDEL